MARKRSLPTTLFASPDFFELSSNTARLIFIGLILDADDEGRGLAHPHLLARKLDQPPDEIEQALVELTAHGMLCCYEVADRHFYWLCHWYIYQTLSKPTPSHYPAPPGQLDGNSGQEVQRNEPDLFPPEMKPKAEAAEPPSASSQAVQKRPPTTVQVAAVLHLPESDDLQQVVQEFTATSSLSLLGEALEARAWIDDQHRNTRQQPMTPAFFRRWLRRSQCGEETRKDRSSREKSGSLTTTSSSIHKPDQYEAYVNALIAQYNGPEAFAEVG